MNASTSERSAQWVIADSQLSQRSCRGRRIIGDEAVLHAAEQPRLAVGDIGGAGFAYLSQPERRVGKASGPDPDSDRSCGQQSGTAGFGKWPLC